jgi:AcrR family transcriptional regulator
MVIRQRAIQAEDKHERHEAILDAAERLLLRSPDRVANVAEVADEAGLAKGTVYLYFPGKEELLLALHERNIDAFFGALSSRLERRESVDVEEVLALTHAHMIASPLFLPLASRCFAQMGQGVTPAVAQAFRLRMGERLLRAGGGLESHFPALGPGDGVVLLRHSYALILGLWQMANAATDEQICPAGGAPPDSPFAWRYEDDVVRALRTLWRGVGAGPGARR